MMTYNDGSKCSAHILCRLILNFPGICCDRGFGAYEFSLGNSLMYSSDFEKTFNDYVEHTFTVGDLYTRQPNKVPTLEPTKAETASPTIKVEVGDPTASPITP
jgi:hypothetical protein